MSRSFWKETAKSRTLERLRNIITIPAFCARINESNRSVHFPGHQENGPDYLLKEYPAGGPTFGLLTTFTFECWLKTFSGGVVFANVEVNGLQNNIYVQINEQKVIVVLRKLGVDYSVTSAASIPMMEWFHLAVVYSSGVATIYINGEVDANTLTLAGPLEADPGVSYSTNIGGSSVLGVDYNFIGHIAEMRVWSVALTLEQLNTSANVRRGRNAGLQRYYKLNQETVATLVDFLDTLTPLSPGSLTPAIEIDEEDYPTLILGASRIAGIFEVSDLSTKVCLKYPIKKPEDVNFMLCVAWLENEDAVFFSRRRLWDMDGVVIHPTLPERYRAEKLPENFRFEVWAVDGASNAQLLEDLVIRTSHTSLPSHMRDEDEPDLFEDALAINQDLFEPFTLTDFPLEFDDDIYGTCESPGIFPVRTQMSNNLTVWGSIQ